MADGKLSDISDENSPQPSTLENQPAQTLEEDLEKHLDLEMLITSFSTALINLPVEGLEMELGTWLEKFAKHLQADRVVLSEYSPDKKNFFVIQSYSNPVLSLPPIPTAMSVTSASERMKTMFAAGEVLVVERVADDLAIDEQGIGIVEDGAKSFVIIPMASGGTILGNLIFGVFSNERKWPNYIVRGFKRIGAIIANALLRRQTQKDLLAEVNRREQLEMRSDTILKTIDLGFWIVGLDHHIREVNDAYCRMTGYSREELIGKTIHQLDVVHTPVELEGQRDIVRQQGYNRHQAQHRCKDGRIIHLEVSSALLAEQGVVFSFVRDITEFVKTREELEDRLEFEDLILNFSTDLLNAPQTQIESVLDKWMHSIAKFLNIDRCTVAEYNKDFTRRRHIHAYTKSGLFQLPVPDKSWQPAYDFAGLFQNRLRLIMNHIPRDIPREMNPVFAERLISDGTKSMLCIPLRAGAQLFGIVMFTSFTHENMWTDNSVDRLQLLTEIISSALIQNKSDQELEQHKEYLQRLVADRTRSLHAAQKNLVESERLAALGKLTATVSHEMRNPLGTIKSSLYYMRERMAGSDMAIDEPINIAENSIERCDLVIEELLDFARTRDLIVKETEIDPWLSDLLDDEPMPNGLNLVRHMSAGVKISIDDELLHRSITNLIHNAVHAVRQRHGSQNTGRIDVATRVMDNSLQIVITDNGEGIAPELLGRLFEPMFTTKSHGLGLGMPIAKRIVEQHGGSILVDSILGERTTVTLQMPLTF